MSSEVLRCEAVVKRYDEGPDHLQILSGIDLTVGRGERIAIVGSSGSGKTTLLNILGGLDKPTQGTVSLLSTRLEGLNESELGQLRNEKLGFVYQFHHLLAEFSAFENVAMPLLIRRKMPMPEIRRRSEQLLDRVGLGQRLKHKPAELSGGERQRVAIARALVGEPALVLMDEPTGNLDSHTAAEIHHLMLDLSRQLETCFVIVTHDMALAGQMDRVYTLTEGQLRQQ